MQSNFEAESTLVSYHSEFNSDNVNTLCGIAFLPLKTTCNGPAEVLPPSDTDDIIDETLGYFRAQMFFKNFEVKGPADKTMIYITVFIQKCLEVIAKK